jgi:predicted DCC family thiol-disulfide oxidoreductase YuxK
MKNIAILSIAGLAAAATAQSVTLHFDIDGDPLTGNDVVAAERRRLLDRLRQLHGLRRRRLLRWLRRRVERQR